MTKTKKNTKALKVVEPERNLPTFQPDSAEALIAQAIDRGVPVESLERLLAMRRELKAERAKEAYDRAMAKFQSECPTIEKRVQGYNYKYADLTAIIEQVKDLLSENGFSYTFDTDEAENAVIIYCKVSHVAGHFETSKATIKKETTTKMNASQQSGAAMTYGKRYAFVNAFGILTGDEDTDGRTFDKKRETAYPTKRRGNIIPVSEKTEEEVKQVYEDTVTKEDVPVVEATPKITPGQKIKLIQLLPKKGKTMTALEQTVSLTTNNRTESYQDLTIKEATEIITKLESLPDVSDEYVDPDEAEKGIEQMKLAK